MGDNMKWTKAQHSIIDHRTGTLLVSAAAGSGKTAVLVQRILEWVVKDRKNIDEFLVVTFTNAAASQMKSKIRKALEAMQGANPEDEHLIRQLSLIHRANIMTIDSFCKSIFNEHFQKLQLDPSMRILDETEGVLLQEDVMERVLGQAYDTMSDAMTQLHGYMNDSRSNENIRKLIQSVSRQADSFPYPERWLEAAEQDAKAITGEAINKTAWMGMLIQEVKTLFEEVMAYPERVCQEYQVLGPEYCPKNHEKYETYFQQECQMLQKIQQAGTYQELQKAFSTKNRAVARFVWKNTGVPEEHYIAELWKRYAEVKKEAKERVKAPMETIEQQQEDVSPVLLTILTLSRQFMQEYRLEKQKRNCMDFSDVEHYALQILADEQEDGTIQPSEVAEQLRDAFVEIMIDEYQDSNDLQEAILTSIARQENQEYSNMFMVGDIKQSIYRFRMARPKLFQRKYEQYDSDLDAEGILKRAELKQNFRSRREVLESVNLLFYQIMSRSLGGITYDASVALAAGRSFKELPSKVNVKTEILFIDSMTEPEAETYTDGSYSEEEDTEESVEEMTLEARVIAMKIQELCNPEHPLLVWEEEQGEYRPCTYRDIVILLRAGKTVTEEYRQVFMEAGIPVYAESGKGYFDSVEVKNILNMLSVIDNARDDIALAGVLRSPLVGLKEEQLANIRCESRERSLWDAVRAYVTLEDADEHAVSCLKRFFAQLTAWKEKKTYSTIRELIWDILNETGYYEYVTAMPHGTVRQANIYKLIEKASAYETTSYRGLFDFLRYIERVRIAEQDFGEAAVLGANDNLVQIMTIHKSKGLEFPVVIVGGCGRPFNQQDRKDVVLVDADGYLAVDDKNLEKHYFERTKKRECLKRHIREENLAEEMRVLYVAMTRAQEKLILVGSVKKTLVKNEDYQAIYRRWQAEGSEPIKRADEQKPEYAERNVKAANIEAGTKDAEVVPNVIPKSKLLKCDSYLSWLAEGIFHIQNQKIDNRCFEYQIITPDMLDWQVGQELDRFGQAVRNWQERITFHTTEEALQTVRERFRWEYSHPFAATRKGKLSVSEIKKMSQVIDEPQQEIPKEYFVAMNPDINGGSSYGTLVHLVMEKIKFSLDISIDSVDAAIEQMADDGIITVEERRMIPTHKIYNMLNSELGARMRKAEERGQLYKEQQFVIGMPMNEVYSDTEEQDLELIQGIIDAYFEEEGELVLMDYKTDRVSKEHGEEELRKKYYAQLDYYKRTLERLTGKHVKETYIYSFSLEAVIEVIIE